MVVLFTLPEDLTQKPEPFVSGYLAGLRWAATMPSPDHMTKRLTQLARDTEFAAGFAAACERNLAPIPA